MLQPVKPLLHVFQQLFQAGAMPAPYRVPMPTDVMQLPCTHTHPFTHPRVHPTSWCTNMYAGCCVQVEGEAQSFLDHIQLGVETAAADPAALLLFSGGQTRKAAGPRSEGLSYWMAAEAAGWFGLDGVRSRAYTEVRAWALPAAAPTAVLQPQPHPLLA